MIDAETCDLHTEWVHADERIRHSVAQCELNLGDVRFVFPFLPRPLAVVVFFEVDRRYVTVAALSALADEGIVPATKVADAIKKYGIDANKPSPVTV